MPNDASVANPKTGHERVAFQTSQRSIKVQHANNTRVNRYPQIFQVVSDLYRASQPLAPRVLSYGCSTGQEADSLSRLYFTDADILAVDVSSQVLDQARERYGSNPRLAFEMSDPEFLAKQPKFSIIFAMSVLCRWPETFKMADISQLFPFSKFEYHVELLDSILEPGGFLVIFNASYNFLQAKISANYDLVLYPRIPNSGFVKQFDRDGKFAEGRQLSDCIYRKKPATASIDRRKLVILNHHLKMLGCIYRDLAIP